MTTWGRFIARGAVIVATVVSTVPTCRVLAQAPTTFKVAFYNIKSGKGQIALSGHPAVFADTSNCTDLTRPLNAWGAGVVQQHLTRSIGNDSRVVALGLSEAWACGSPENVRRALGWRARTSERNGVALAARYGLAGPEEWEQLDTSLNDNPADTMWVLRVPVCLDDPCSSSMIVFVSHWYGWGTDVVLSYDRQAAGAVDFLTRTAETTPHVLVGDLNVWEAPGRVCYQDPMPAGLQRLRDAGYVDAWPLLHGDAEGFTGMTNRVGCGLPEGAVWKRPDYIWSRSDVPPISMSRFGIVPAGDASPSDHYGIIAEFVMSSADLAPPEVALVAPLDGLRVQGGPVSISVVATDNRGVARVEILEDGVAAHTLSAGWTAVSCTHLASLAGAHTVAARAFDAAGNMGQSDLRHVIVESPAPGAALQPGEIVLYARNAPTIVGGWQVVADASAAGGARLWNPDAGASKVLVPAASPANYFELTFQADAGRPYRLWVRGRAERDSWSNDSVYAQFGGSVDAGGTPTARIGTASGYWIGIEDCSGCGLLGWGWQDNGYGAGILGPLVYFAFSGPQTVRIQQREDGISLDQVVLSPLQYLMRAPGASKQGTLILAQSEPTDRAEILLTAAGAPKVSGAWRQIADASAAGGVAVGTADAGVPKLTTALASPPGYVDFTFSAYAGRDYRVWVRGRAANDLWSNDSAFLQFDGTIDAAGAAVARIGTTGAFTVNLEETQHAGVAGWGWQDNGYGAGVLGPAIRFGVSGRQTIRIQTREDGFRFDQIVLSSTRYLTTAPGSTKNDATILAPPSP